MNPIHGERGKFYYAVECNNQDCRQKLYVQELESNATDDSKGLVVGQSVRCPMCTQETLIEARRLVVIEVR